MTNYVILRTEELAEGVYLASGCYTASAYIHQTPQSGSGEYRIQVNGQHSADHTKEAQTLTISFSLPVTYTSSGGSLVSGSGTNTLVINYNYHQNPTDNIGLGDLVVQADAGLAVTSVDGYIQVCIYHSSVKTDICIVYCLHTELQDQGREFLPYRLLCTFHLRWIGCHCGTLESSIPR